jgi:hypothetical protein
MHQKIIVALVVISSIVGLRPEASMAAPKSFQTPSGNISCGLVEGNEIRLRCEIASSLRPKPAQPYTGYCQFDWGRGFSLPTTGKPAILCISDTIADRNQSVLAYGHIWKNAGFKCVSQRSGLTCTNTTGQGFFLSREKWRVLGVSQP